MCCCLTIVLQKFYSLSLLQVNSPNGWRAILKWGTDTNTCKQYTRFNKRTNSRDLENLYNSTKQMLQDWSSYHTFPHLKTFLASLRFIDGIHYIDFQRRLKLDNHIWIRDYFTQSPRIWRREKLQRVIFVLFNLNC